MNERDGSSLPDAPADEAATGVRHLLDDVGVALWECAVPDLRPTWVSDGIVTLLGYPKEFWLSQGDSEFDAIVPEDRARVLSIFRRAAENDEPHDFQHRIRCADGQVIWVRQIIGLSPGTSPTSRLRGIMMDITAQKRTEQALRESEERFRQITENINELFWVTDVTSQTVLYVSSAFETMTGYSANDLIEGRVQWMGMVHVLDRERVTEAMRGISEGKRYDEVLRIVRADGVIRWIHSRGFPVLNDGGQVHLLVGVAEDITERRQAEETSRESDERFQFVARATLDVLYDWDISENTVWWSGGYETQLGYDRSGLLPAEESWLKRIHPDDREWVVQSVKRALEMGRESWSARYRFRRADGTYLQMLDRGFTKFDKRGRPVRMLGAFVDVTRQQQLESQLEQMKRVASLGALAANMAHEFNNVLMGIQPFSDVIRRVVPEQPRVQEAIGRINQSIARGRKVTDQILRFTRKTEPTREPVVVREWIEDFHEEAEALLDGGAGLEIRLPDEPLLVHIDRSQMNQVLTNLILNAREVSPPDSTIVLTVRFSPVDSDARSGRGFLHLTVEDRGPGISPELTERIFEPLFTTRKNGTGLGLAISNQIVTAHDGRVYAENRDGGGACLHVLLPISEADAGSAPSPGASSPPLPRRVLIVDDEPDVAAGLEALLSIEDVSVEVIYRGSDAVSVIRRVDPDIVLLDVALPDVSGPDVYEEIAEEFPDLPVIFMSGHYNVGDLRSAASSKRVSFLQKPFTRDQLFHVLSEAVRTTRGAGGRA